MAGLNLTISALANQIGKHAQTITEHLNSQGLAEPSFSADSPAALPHTPEVQAARMSLIEASLQLHHLAVGATEYLSVGSILMKHDQMAVDILNQFNFWDAVPLEGNASVDEIAEKVGLSSGLVRRVLRHSMTLNVFAETTPGSDRIVHTAASAYLVREPLTRAMIGHNIEDLCPAAIKQVELLKTFGESSDPTKAAVILASYPDHFGKKGWFELAENEGEGDRKGWRAKRFTEAMKSYAKTEAGSVKHIHAGFDWNSINDGAVVDIGGSAGHHSVEIVENYSKLKVIVQDLPHVEPQFDAVVPQQLKERLTFQAYDFFTPQPVKGADVYFLKHILHDWPDSFAVRILRNVLPALKKGSRILIIDAVMPPRGMAPLFAERLSTALDLQMLVALSAKERSLEDWQALFKEADERLVLKNVKSPPGSFASYMELVLQSD